MSKWCLGVALASVLILSSAQLQVGARPSIVTADSAWVIVKGALVLAGAVSKAVAEGKRNAFVGFYPSTSFRMFSTFSSPC